MIRFTAEVSGEMNCFSPRTTRTLAVPALAMSSGLMAVVSAPPPERSFLRVETTRGLRRRAVGKGFEGPENEVNLMTDIPPTPPTAQQTPLPSRTCPQCQMQVPAKAYVGAYCKKRLRTSPMTWGCLVLIGLPTLARILSRSTSTPPAPAPKSAEEAKREATQKAQQETPPSALDTSRKAEVMRAVRLDFQWRKGAFDTVMEAKFTITNPTEYAIRDIEITCVHFAPSGTRIDSHQGTIYERIKPRGRKVIRNFNMGFIHSQAKSSGCTITDLVIEPKQ